MHRNVDSKGSSEDVSKLAPPVAPMPQSQPQCEPMFCTDGKKLPALDLHQAPGHLRGTGEKRRFIFRRRARNPNGPILIGTLPAGKTAGSGLPIWGAYASYHHR